MIQKTFIEEDGNPLVRVTFTLPNCIWADAIYLVGDFNDWDLRLNPFQRDPDGGWTITVDLEVGRAYQFRYLRDGEAWMNDRDADAYVPNVHGSDNFVIITDPCFERHCDEEDA